MVMSYMLPPHKAVLINRNYELTPIIVLHSIIDKFVPTLTVYIMLWFTGWSCSIDTIHSKYCNTELHTSRKCHCSVGVTSGDVGVDTVIRGVDDSDHILHCTVTHTPANQY